MKNRLEWILYQINKLNGDGQIRYEGNSVFQGAKMELESVIGSFDADIAALAAASPPVVEQVVMAADQVAEVIASIQGLAAFGDTIAGLEAAVHEAIEQSDLAVMAAINEKGNEVLAALTPAA